MKKTLKKIMIAMASVIIVTMGILSMTALAEEEIGINQVAVQSVTWNFDSQTGMLTISGTGAMSNYTSSNPAPWSQYAGQMTSVIINNGVTSIGNYSFYNCLCLTSVTISNSVTGIGGEAFSGCSGITDLTMPAGANFDCSIYTPSFYGCTGITSITLTGNGAIRNYDTMTCMYTPWYQSRNNSITITICDGVTGIGDYAFSECSGLTEIVIPDSVMSIGNYAFSNCTGLTLIDISDGVTSTGNYSFSGCISLAEVTVGNGITSIGNGVFSRCTGLTSIDIPDGVTSIGNYAFSSSGLTSLEIPDSVTSIGACAFFGCNKIRSLTMPVGANFDCSVNNDPSFYGCTGITSVTLTGNGSMRDYSISAGYNYLGMTPWYQSRNNSITVTVCDGVTDIGDYAFWGCVGLAEVVIPDSVMSIGNDAFYYCTGLTDVYYGSSLSRRQSMTIEGDNSSLINAMWHYTPCEHTKTFFSAVAATCTETGNIEYWKCIECDRYFSNEECTAEITQAQTVIPALGHTKEHHAAVTPTCKGTGNTEYWYCTACHKYFSDEACTTEITQAQTVIPAAGHAKEHHAAVTPTCKETGNTEYWYCTACHKYFSDEACMAEITQQQTVISAKGHSIVHHPRTEATYTVSGNIEYWSCSECGKYFSDETCTTEITQAQTVIPKKEVPSIEGKFSDVAKGDWFYDSVAFVNAAGIMKGMGGTDNFAPGEPLSRSQLAVMLHRLENSPQTAYAPIFPDVPDGTWYSQAVIWAYNNGIITGYQNGYFGIADNITREQLAVMLYRYAANYKHLNVSNKADISGFTDAGKVSSWAREAIEWAVGSGIITGKDSGTRIDPQGEAARCECAAMFKRFMEWYGL